MQGPLSVLKVRGALPLATLCATVLVTAGSLMAATTAASAPRTVFTTAKLDAPIVTSVKVSPAAVDARGGTATVTASLKKSAKASPFWALVIQPGRWLRKQEGVDNAALVEGSLYVHVGR